MIDTILLALEAYDNFFAGDWDDHQNFMAESDISLVEAIYENLHDMLHNGNIEDIWPSLTEDQANSLMDDLYTSPEGDEAYDQICFMIAALMTYAHNKEMEQ